MTRYRTIQTTAARLRQGDKIYSSYGLLYTIVFVAKDETAVLLKLDGAMPWTVDLLPSSPITLAVAE